METKFTGSKKEKVSIATELSIEGINVQVYVYGQKLVLGNGEELSNSRIDGNGSEQFQNETLANIKNVDIQALIDKAIEDFKSK